MDADELALVVSEMARKGSVSAAELRWKMLKEVDDPALNPWEAIGR